MVSRVALLLLLVLASSPALGQDDDPKWKGRTLSSWVRDLAHEQESKRYDALTALYYLAHQGKAEPAVTPLIQALGDTSSACAQLAALTLGTIGGSAIPPLVLTLNAQETKLRLAAARALEHMQPGSLTAPAVAALEEALRDDDPTVQAQAAIALGRTKSAAALGALVRRLTVKKEKTAVRAAAAFALGELGLATQSALSALRAKQGLDAARVAAFRLWCVGRAKLTPEGKAAYRKGIEALARPRALAWYRARSPRALKTARRRRRLLGYFSRRARVAMNLSDQRAEDAMLETLAQATPATLVYLRWPRLPVDQVTITSASFEGAVAVVKARLKQADQTWEETSRWAWVGSAWVLETFADKRPDPFEPKQVKRSKGVGTDSAIAAALNWLARHQSPAGGWDNDAWARSCRSKPVCKDERVDASSYDVGLTGLTLLAFLGDGHTPSQGKHAGAVRRAIAWLKRQQRADGSIGWSHGSPSVYNHHFATLALGEVMRMTQDSTLRRTLAKAVKFTAAAANPGLGWKYGSRTGKNDTSVTGVALLSLFTARHAGVSVPKKTLEGGQKWLLRATSHSGEVGYETPGGGSSVFRTQLGQFDQQQTMTALSVAVRLLLGDRRRADALRKGVRLVRQHPPKWGKKTLNFYHWHWGTRALRLWGGNAWKQWTQDLQAALLPKQVMKTCADGSWAPQGQWAIAGGRVYATALNALSLEGIRDEQPWLEP